MHDLLCTQPLLFSHRFLFCHLSNGPPLRHHSSDFHANNIHSLLCRMHPRGSKPLTSCFSTPRFALPAWWLLGGVQILSVAASAHAYSAPIVFTSPPTFVPICVPRTSKASHDPVMDVRIRTRAVAGFPNFFMDRVRRPAVRKEAKMHAPRIIKPKPLA